MLQRILKRDGDHREKKDCYWFVGIEKRAVLTEVMTFGDPHVDKRRCLQIIRKLLYLLNQGQTFTKVAIVTNSLLKDINNRAITYRANVIRLLCRITNGISSSQTEEYLKEAIMDMNPVVSSAALVCALHLLKRDPRIGNKLSEQVGKAVRSRAKLVQFHALCLLFQMQQNDLLGVEELARRYTEGELKCNGKVIHSPLGLCLVARSISEVSRGTHVSVEHYPGYYKYLKRCICDEAEMVGVEGFRAMEELKRISSRELKAEIAVMRQFLGSPKPVLKFAAFRALHKVVMAHQAELYKLTLVDRNIHNYYFADLFKRVRLESPNEELPADDVVTQSLNLKHLRTRKPLLITLGGGEWCKPGGAGDGSGGGSGCVGRRKPIHLN